MTERRFIEAKLRRDAGMTQTKAERRTVDLLSQPDLHHFCPECGHKNTGTLEELERGCTQCLIQ